MGTEFKPFVSDKVSPAEFTIKAVVIGLALGFIFGLGIMYLGLKVGMTISASIPASIMSMALLKMFKKSTILENNISQTIASAGEGLAGGVAFTIPALFFAAENTPTITIFCLAIIGGLLGVFFMIPLRRVVIIEEHGRLPFPEGTACAEILKIGQKKPEHGMPAFIGLLTAGLYKIIGSVCHLWPESARFHLPNYPKIIFSVDATPALLGVGYLIGANLSLTLLAGSIFSWWFLIPVIDFFAGSASIFPATISIATMSAEQIWGSYIRYIGAGGIAIGGILSLLPIFPMLIRLLKGLRIQKTNQKKILSRLDKALSMKWVPLWIFILALALWLLPFIQMNFLTTILSLLFGFFFVAVTSFTVGIVGVSSSPISGMILTSLLATCGVFVALNWTQSAFLISAITLGSVVSIACAIAADTSQDLKTGFLVGATPKKQQLGMILGVVFVSTIMGFAIKLFNEVYQIGSMQMPAPQATLVYLLAKGVLSGNLPFALILFGVMIGLVMRLLRISVMAFAIGMYLPLSLVVAIAIGGMVHMLIKSFFAMDEHMTLRATLFTSGLIGADALMGVVIALFTVFHLFDPGKQSILSQGFSLFTYLLLALFLGYYIAKEKLLPKNRAK